MCSKLNFVIIVKSVIVKCTRECGTLRWRANISIGNYYCIHSSAHELLSILFLSSVESRNCLPSLPCILVLYHASFNASGLVIRAQKIIANLTFTEKIVTCFPSLLFYTL
jgi:hypothetical protein